jgi:FlaA1/EpsC-like NDP-sugar epimerase
MMHNTPAAETLWSDFAGQYQLPSFPRSGQYISGKSLLITGAGGSIGSALARFATKCDVGPLVLLDSDERRLYDLKQWLDFSGRTPHTAILGSICDSRLLSDLFTFHRPQIILHAAACKHVPLMELNPLAAASVNVLGTLALLQTASEFEASHFIMVSTDKAVLPKSVMGVTKRLAELVLFAHPDKDMVRKAVRLGNVLGSSGSVGPLFCKQINEGGPVTVSHPDARRFFLTLDRAVFLLLASLAAEYGTGILVPDLGKPKTVEELARYLIAAKVGDQRFIEVIFTGLRPGDKLEEILSSNDESTLVRDGDLFSTRQPKGPAPEVLQGVVRLVAVSVRERNLGLLLASICEAVPEYLPSPLLHPTLSQAESRK